MRSRVTGALALSLCSFALPAEAQAPQSSDILNSGRKTVQAVRLAEGESITLDGVLDEPVWKRTSPAGEFIMQDPMLGGTPTEPTEVHFAFNDDHLYMAVVCRDSEPDKLLGNTRKRDEFLSADDRFMWTIDTFLNQQTGYFFEMNPSGLMADALMGPGGTTNREWDGIWNAKVRRSEVGWVIEIDLPFRSFAFDPNAPAWGINFQRTVRRKNEETVWTGHLRNQGLRRMSNAGLLVGLRDVTQGHGLEVRPYVAGYSADAPGRPTPLARHDDVDVGGEIAYNITPSLRAVGTINTDFAETEVDQRRVNLTRFPLFFPEKRSFFLDGATFFDFYVPAFFSRRIGLDANGQPQRIIGGSKVTGQAGAYDIGGLYVSTGEENGVRGENFTAVRVRRRVLRQSYVGGIYTGRTTRDQSLVATRSTAGVDFRLATATFRGNKNLEASGFMTANTVVGEQSGDNVAFGGRVAYPNDIWDTSMAFMQMPENTNYAVGFVERRNFRRYQPAVRYNPRPNQHPYIRRFSFGGDLDLYTDLENQAVSRSVDLTVGRVELHSGDNIEFSVEPTYERLEEDFTIYPGVTLPKGAEYEFTRYQLSAGTANKRIIAIQPRLEWGRFLSGHRREAIMGLGIRPRPGITVNVNYELNNVDLVEGKFETRLYRVVADTQFSPFIYLVNNVQYDSVSRVLGWQSRFRWILKPGNDIFFVYTHNWLDPVDPSRRYTTLDRRAAAKAVYTKRF
ncbi:MAG TPA: carbohydrate binding family 9 domain-containing protein [Vicinamibacterales bacterium]